jgi:hypothetical protein
MKNIKRVKISRNMRLDNFIHNIYPVLEGNYIITKGKAHCYTIYSVRFGFIDFFVVEDKCLLRKKSKWIKPGLEWIQENLISKL